MQTCQCLLDEPDVVNIITDNPNHRLILKLLELCFMKSGLKLDTLSDDVIIISTG